MDFSVTNYSECVENIFNRKTYLSPNANFTYPPPTYEAYLPTIGVVLRSNAL